METFIPVSPIPVPPTNKNLATPLQVLASWPHSFGHAYNSLWRKPITTVLVCWWLANADLIDTEIDDMDVSDVKDWSDEQSRDDPDDNQDDDRSALSGVQLLTASRRCFHREIMIDAQRRQREDAARYCQTCHEHNNVRILSCCVICRLSVIHVLCEK